MEMAVGEYNKVWMVFSSNNAGAFALKKSLIENHKPLNISCASTLGELRCSRWPARATTRMKNGYTRVTQASSVATFVWSLTGVCGNLLRNVTSLLETCLAFLKNLQMFCLEMNPDITLNHIVGEMLRPSLKLTAMSGRTIPVQEGQKPHGPTHPLHAEGSREPWKATASECFVDSALD